MSDKRVIRYRPEIDGLRAISVLLVVFYHIESKWVSGGFVGVDVFFVISGYLITSILRREMDSGKFSITGFYRRRVNRIFPALILTLLFSFAWGWWVLLPEEFVQLSKHIYNASLFLSNFTLWRESGYFDVSAELKPLLHLWSLAVEEQFYLLWPVVLLLSITKPKYFGRALLVIFCLSLLSNLILIGKLPVATFYLPHSRLWELLLGAVLAQLGPTFRVRYPTFLSAIGLLFIFGSAFLIDRKNLFPGGWALFPTVGAALVILAGSSSWLSSAILSSRPFVFVGKISYPLYLWHWPLLVFARIQSGGASAPLEYLMGAGVLAGILSVITYLYVDKPIHSAPLVAAQKICKLLIASMILIGIISNLTYKKKIVRPYASRQQPERFERILFAANDWWFPGNLVSKTTQKGDSYLQFGERQGAVLFLGDSNAEQYYSATEELVRKNGNRSRSAIFVTLGSCPPIPLVKESHHPKCAEVLERGIRIAQEPFVEKIVLAAQWNHYFAGNKDAYYFDSPTSGALPLNDSKDAKMQAFESFKNLILKLRSLNKEVFILLNIPVGDEFDPRKISFLRKIWGGRIELSPSVPVPLSEIRSRLAFVNGELTALARESGVQILDPLHDICPSDPCDPISKEGYPLYRDRDHFSAKTAREKIRVLDPLFLGP